jgi:predicted GNAT superfamily acetyltransferase
MVGVLREYQDRGVGRLLKLAQRDDAIARGIGLIEWTFDPMQLKNAHFNLAKLGAIVRRYLPNVYGRTSSPLHAGLPTDRLVAEWWLKSDHVKRVLSGHGPSSGNGSSTRISLPSNIRQVCAEDPARAESIQSEVRQQFSQQFVAGRAAVGFEFAGDAGSYVLELYEDRID